MLNLYNPNHRERFFIVLSVILTIISRLLLTFVFTPIEDEAVGGLITFWVWAPLSSFIILTYATAIVLNLIGIVKGIKMRNRWALWGVVALLINFYLMIPNSNPSKRDLLIGERTNQVLEDMAKLRTQ